MSTTNEAQVRRAARRRGLQLTKSRQQTPDAADFGTYWLTDPAVSNALLLGGQFGVSLETVEDFLEDA